VPVPNVVGTQCGPGAHALTTQGFNVAINGNQDGFVTAQNPSGGSAPPGSQVAIVCT
jgi:hypothetical protein